MPKKLKLKNLKVQSFVTELGNSDQKVKGGALTPQTLCIVGTCVDCTIGACPTDTCDTCGGSCGGTCGQTACQGTCATACGTCDTDCTCGLGCITVPSCPQIICG